MSPIRLLFRLTVSIAALVVAAALVVLFLAFDTTPALERATELTPAHIERAQRILRNNDPRRLRTGAVRTVDMSAEDADVAANYLMHRYANGSAQMRFADGGAEVRASLRAPMVPARPFVNLTVGLAEGDPIPTVTAVRVGALPVPVRLAQFLFNRALPATATAELQTLRDAVRDVQLQTSGLQLTYEWQNDLAETVRSALVPADDRERLRAYQQALADATNALPARAPMVELLTPVFRVALERSRQGSAVAENRAAILVLTSYVIGQPLGQIVPEARSWPRPRRRMVTLNGRDDLAKHFLVSAALAANTGGPFADAVGMYKEVSDSQGGSGFSFIDMAADRAGSRLGTLAEGTGSAPRLQSALAAAVTEDAVMPATTGLVEALTEEEFKRRFGDVDAPAYRQVIDEIDRRIAALPFYGSAGR